MVKNLPEMQETRVQSLDREDPLEKGTVSILVFLLGESHGQRSLVGYSPWGCSQTRLKPLSTHTQRYKGMGSLLGS